MQRLQLLLDRYTCGLEQHPVPLDLGAYEAFKIARRAPLRRHHIGAVFGKLFLDRRRFHRGHAGVVKTFLMIAAGVALGAKKPNQVEPSKFTPCSNVVGTFGTDGIRAWLNTAEIPLTQIVLQRRRRRAADRAEIIKLPSKSRPVSIAGPLPRYGISPILTPIRLLKSSRSIPPVEPTPAKPRWTGALVLLHVGDEVSQLSAGKLLRATKAVRIVSDQDDRRKVGLQIVDRMLIQRHVDRIRPAGEDECVAVRVRSGDVRGTGNFAGAGDASTITVWPRISDMRCAMMRPITSVPPPAADGTTRVSGCVGQSSALAGPIAWPPANTVAATAASTRIKGMVPSQLLRAAFDDWHNARTGPSLRQRVVFGNDLARGPLQRLRTHHALLRLLHAVVVAHRNRFIFWVCSRREAGRQTRHVRVVIGVVEEHD